MTLIERVRQLLEQHGGLRPAARATQVDVGYLYRLASGDKSNPSKIVLRRLGLRKIISYELLSAQEQQP